MCQFGDKSKILSEQELTMENGLIGYRVWYIINSFNEGEKMLKSKNVNFIWPKKEEVRGNPLRENSEGIYNYNYKYYYNYYYNNYYNYYYNNNNNYNNYNYN